MGNEDYYDLKKDDEEWNDKSGIRSQKKITPLQQEKTTYDPEILMDDDIGRLPSHALMDNYLDDDIDDLFDSPQDKEIAEKDVPERLQTKLKNRLAPTPEQLNEEKEWIFNNSCDSIDQGGYLSKEKIEDIKEKIYKVLHMFRNE